MVTGEVAACIIDLLEMIYINYGKHMHPRAGGLPEAGFDALSGRTRVVEAGERIKLRLLAEPFRIAFFRVCSGRYQPGMKVLHVREDREMKIPNALTFMAQDRVIMTDAVAGDIIGIYNHGQLHIGDTLTQGEKLQFTGIPNFAPELFRAARSKDPFKAKQLQKGLQELGEEGAIQVFTGEFGNILLGAVGQLQFEIVAQRLADEYKVDALYESTDVSTARWLSFPDDKTKREFEAEQNARLATDVNGNEVYLATSIYNLETTMKHWPQVQFHTTREMNQVF